MIACTATECSPNVPHPPNGSTGAISFLKRPLTSEALHIWQLGVVVVHVPSASLSPDDTSPKSLIHTKAFDTIGTSLAYPLAVTPETNRTVQSTGRTVQRVERPAIHESHQMRRCHQAIRPPPPSPTRSVLFCFFLVFDIPAFEFDPHCSQIFFVAKCLF